MPILKVLAMSMNLMSFIKKHGFFTTALFPHLPMRLLASGKGFSAFCVAGLCLGSGIAAAQTASPQTASPQIDIENKIDSAVENYLGQVFKQQAAQQGWRGLRFTHSTTTLNSSEGLSPCAGALQVTPAGRTGLTATRQRLDVRCPGAAGWEMPVSSQIAVFLPVVVTGEVIDRGATITPAQLVLQEQEISKLTRGFYHRVDQVTDQGARRRMRAGQVITPSLLTQPTLVRRGQKVTMVATRDGISASAPGEAMEHGQQGAVIKVKNLRSGKVVEALVLENGSVTSTF
jgi:flagella basal body P-ring formation protein FlgA